METFRLYDKVLVTTTGGEGMIIEVYDNDEYRTDVDGVRSGSELIHKGKHLFSEDISLPFDNLITKGQDWIEANKKVILDLIGNGITTGCVPNKKNLCKIIDIFTENDWAYVGDLRRIGLMIIDGQYKNEFRFQYHKKNAYHICSATGEYFSMIRQILNYNN